MKKSSKTSLTAFIYWTKLGTS